MKTIKCHLSDAVKVEEFHTASFLVKDEVSESPFRLNSKLLEEYILPEKIKTEPIDESDPIVKSEYSDENRERYILPGAVDNLDIKAEPKDELCVFDVTTASLVEGQPSFSVANNCTSLHSDSHPSFKDSRTILKDTDAIAINYKNSQTRCPDSNWEVHVYVDHAYCRGSSATTSKNKQNDVHSNSSKSDSFGYEDSTNEDCVLVNDVDVEERTSGDMLMDEDGFSENDQTGQSTTSNPENVISENASKNRNDKKRLPLWNDSSEESDLGNAESLQDLTSSDHLTTSKDTLNSSAGSSTQNVIGENLTMNSIDKVLLPLWNNLNEDRGSHFSNFTSGESLETISPTNEHSNSKKTLSSLAGSNTDKPLFFDCTTIYNRKHSDYMYRPFKCIYCGYRYSFEAFLEHHLKIYHNVKAYSCNSSSDRKYNCDSCNFSSNRKYNCDSCNFSSDRKYNCDSCNFSSNRKSNLTRHSQKHSIENLYKCEYCDFTCIYMKSFRTHITKHAMIQPIRKTVVKVS